MLQKKNKPNNLLSQIKTMSVNFTSFASQLNALHNKL